MTLFNPKGLSPATSDWDACQRYSKYKALDPLPEVDPALLNSGDAYDYICHAGIIYPFASTEDLTRKFKTASYEIDLLGRALFIDEKGASQDILLEKSKKFTFPRNSIVYIIPKTMFRLPDYIALRFNLKITHVHAGLLLGTGPLVDPGYTGQLMVPVHNLTSKDYHVVGGDGFIWIEFTKLSRHKVWDESHGREGAATYFDFKNSKGNRSFDPTSCLNKATGGTPAVSSIPTTLQQATNVLTQFSELKKLVTFVGLPALIFATLGIVIPTWQLIYDANTEIDSRSLEVVRYQRDQILRLEKDVERLKSDLRKINLGIHGIKRDLDSR